MGKTWGTILVGNALCILFPTHYNVFAIESNHPEQSESVHDTYPIEQDTQNVSIDSLDMSYDREEIDQNNDDNDLAKERSGNNLHWQWELILPVGTLSWQWECLVHFIPNSSNGDNAYTSNPPEPTIKRDLKLLINFVLKFLGIVRFGNDHVAANSGFWALCYPKNDREDIGKLGAKCDIGFFIGYSPDSCAYQVYNRKTKNIMQTINVTFDELSATDFEQSSSKPRLQGMTSK
uniref:Integrase, catalytic region, zinc finger, CCHC-type, peptidase aspartic, catalytic n=1 Tax=Tanacetum cinerariifolium TaxID=118510 RepID=A0A699GVK6_TANCI|nr:integrase, catalytic region, zinc finger, CCHC-type, peptidase aspartic, catalytic [Tanacetum cinerariifolium]